MDGSTAKRSQDIGLILIKTAMNQSGHLYKTHFDNVESVKAYFIDKGALLIDATMQRAQWPQAADYQQGMYSVKKANTASADQRQIVNSGNERPLYSLCEQSLAR